LNSSDASGVGVGGLFESLIDGFVVDLSFICWSVSTGGFRSVADIVGFMVEMLP